LAEGDGEHADGKQSIMSGKPIPSPLSYILTLSHLAPSPARLSSISSSLLTSLLSLARLRSSPIPVPIPPSLTSSIRKQWIQLDQGIQSLEDDLAKKEGIDPSEERVVEELKEQCERLKDLASKEGVDGLESVRREKKLRRGEERTEVQLER
jgi:hypothetical protein